MVYTRSPELKTENVYLWPTSPHFLYVPALGDHHSTMDIPQRYCMFRSRSPQ